MVSKEISMRDLSIEKANDNQINFTDELKNFAKGTKTFEKSISKIT